MSPSDSLWVTLVRGQPHGFFTIQHDSQWPPTWVITHPDCTLPEHVSGAWSGGRGAGTERWAEVRKIRFNAERQNLPLRSAHMLCTSLDGVDPYLPLTASIHLVSIRPKRTVLNPVYRDAPHYRRFLAMDSYISATFINCIRQLLQSTTPLQRLQQNARKVVTQ